MNTTTTIGDRDGATVESLQNADATAEASTTKPKPIIGVTMGSATDFESIRPALALLDNFSLPYELTITSSHRTPQYMLDWSRTAASRGLKVIICAAGSAAHCPGMLASVTPLPVIGIPTKARSLDGLDSLLSIVQMPRGVPVGCMAIGGGINAAIYAARMIGIEDLGVRAKVEKYMQDMEDENMENARMMQRGEFEGFSSKVIY